MYLFLYSLNQIAWLHAIRETWWIKQLLPAQLVRSPELYLLKWRAQFPQTSYSFYSFSVASLFPDEVRDQLDQEFVKQQQQQKQGSDTDTENPDINSEPAADLFEETTVMFADLAGFTTWSARKTPAQVFELLETIYSAFDSIAASRNVFKVETIGDCYLAGKIYALGSLYN